MTHPTEATDVFVVVIGDIVGSRDLPDRAAAQEILRSAVEGLNRQAAHGLEAPLKPTGGDEIKAITRRPDLAIDVISRLSDDLHPIRLSWGVGRGTLSTSWVPDVGDLDGPCFHRARFALEEASKQGVWAAARGFSERDDAVISALLRLVGAIRATWTEKQVEYVRSVRQRSQRDTARALGVTESAVSQSLQSARYHDVAAGESVLRSLLASYDDAPDDRAGSDA